MGQPVLMSKELMADLHTPLSAFLSLCPPDGPGMLLESGETVERIGRYSIVALAPTAWLRLWRDGCRLERDGAESTHPAGEFFALARRLGAEGAPARPPALPVVGSLLGYVGFEAVRLLERLGPIRQGGAPIAELCLPSGFAVFDHHLRRLTLAALGADRGEAEARLGDMQARLAAGPAGLATGPAALEISPPPRESYMAAVERAKEYIRDGDIYQVVLSERFAGRTEVDPVQVYRWLRVKSPSPYMFLLRTAERTLVGASPETLVRVEGEQVRLRPIAGTRGRSGDAEEDRALEADMMSSAKELAEHVMLVDLARNDAGRVCSYGSVAVDPYMRVERFSHVMHITSQVNGRLRPEHDAWDAFEAGFPAGTVSGAPKVRALEIIDELEELPRGPYAGAVGHFGPGRRMDTCIGIRMIEFCGDRFVHQVGAGIVADSVPAMEYREIEHKAAQGLAALRAAAEGLS